MDQERSILPTTNCQLQRHYPTPQDVSKALEHLAKRLPVELAEENLRQAEYWPRLLSHVRQRVRVEPLGFRCEAWSAYLVSEAIPKLEGGNGGPAIRIERVKFKMESRDQLWGGDQSFIPPPEDAWSGFDAVVLSESESRGLCDPVKPREIDIERIRDLEARSWAIQRNQYVDPEQRTYEVVWNRGECHPLPMSEDGAGIGPRFIESLKGGDRIALVAHSGHPGWVQCVYEATIEIFYSV